MEIRCVKGMCGLKVAGREENLGFKGLMESSATMAMGVKLPKIDVPTFDGNILNWQAFWEQFSIAIHERSSLSDTEKLVYLRHSLKDGAAKVIEGLSRSGDQYAEAITCLKSCYDRPRLIHQIHVKKIVEIAPLKEGSGKKLCYLHDTAQQHLRSLKAMGQEPSGSFITSLLELNLDQNTMFEWQKCSQESSEVPHYKDLLGFINLRAQASESVSSETKKFTRTEHHLPRRVPPSKPGPTVSFATSASNTDNCALYKNEKHPLYVCTRFNRCRKCQKPHHTLIHDDSKETLPSQSDKTLTSSTSSTEPMVLSHTAAGITSNTLLMTCQVLVKAPDNSSVEARALLDSASSTSFVSERLAQSLCLPRFHHNIRISGIAGLSHQSPLQSVVTFNVSPVHTTAKSLSVSAIVVPRVTCDLPVQPVHFDSQWTHLKDLKLADPDFGRPGRIDILLGIDVYTNVLLHRRRSGPLGSPIAFETMFGWVLAGRTNSHTSVYLSIATHHVSVTSADDLLRKFWEIEESPKGPSNLSPDERLVVQHFKDTHTRSDEGRFIVPLPKRPQSKSLGESRSQAVKRFLSLERSLYLKGQFQEFSTVMEEYFKMNHAELVPVADLQNLPKKFSTSLCMLSGKNTAPPLSSELYLMLLLNLLVVSH